MSNNLLSIRQLSCKEILELLQASLNSQILNTQNSSASLDNLTPQLSKTPATQALFDLLTIMKNKDNPQFNNIRIAFIGNWCELFEAYLDLALYLQIELLFAVPPKSYVNIDKLNSALDLGAKVFVGYEINLALYGANYLVISEFEEIKSQNLNHSDFILTSDKIKNIALLPSSLETNFVINKISAVEENQKISFYQNLANIIGGKNENK